MSVASSACPRCGKGAMTGRLGVCPNCLLAEDPGLTSIGGLEIQEEIGRGGMGAVYRARHSKLGRTVAVKFLPEELAAKPEFRARFEREARALAMLSHPCIVTIHDFGQEGDQSWIVMELVNGKPLSELIPMPADRALDIALQVCDALAYAHAQGVVHRDIKPENILVDDAGRVKVTDFGIARILRSGASAGLPSWTVTKPGEAFGTPHYAAPEVYAGAGPDPRQDLYSLGVVLYRSITGKLPIGSFEPLPGPLNRIVRKALAPEPENRYSDAGAMRTDLLAATRGATTAQEMPADEQILSRAVSGLTAAATGVALWAFLESVTPRVLEPGDAKPLVMLATEKLADGRIVSRARFEQGPILGAVVALSIASASWASLRRHWRLNGLHVEHSDRPLAESKKLLAVAALAVAVYIARRVLLGAGQEWAGIYVPLAGGVLEVLCLYYFWAGILESQRIFRPLKREPLLFAGMLMALIPPGLELVLYLAAWSP